MQSDRSTDGVEEYTRFEADIQLGDGPDQRGSIEVEVLRGTDGNRNPRQVKIPVDGDGLDVEVATEVSDEAFAEFYYELQRSSMALKNALGLEDD